MILSIIFYGYLLVISLFALFSTYLGLMRYVQRPAKSDYKPRTLVIVPCKGKDLTLEENLKSLAGQRYGSYDAVAVVDDDKDEAVRSIKRAGMRFITTDRRFSAGSGKVNAIATAFDRLKNYDVYVIADSDILVKSDWLGLLVAPLGDKSVGISTTFPYFRSRGGFWSRVKTVWGFVGIGMMESEVLRFGWGGSLAFRKEVLDKKTVDAFRHSLSDDIAMTRAVKARGMRLFYVEGAQPIVNTRDTFSTFYEWANRQTAFSIRGDHKVFWIGLVSYLLNILLLVSAIVLSIFYSPVALLLFVPIALGVLKAHSRLREPMPEFALLQLAMPFIFTANLLAARLTKTIEWRGRKYHF